MQQMTLNINPASGDLKPDLPAPRERITNSIKLRRAAGPVRITNVGGLMTNHLWASPCGGLAHAQHWLVLGAIQPTDREPGAADPSHHGDVAVPEEAMQKMIHGIGKWWKGADKKKESVKGRGI